MKNNLLRRFPARLAAIARTAGTQTVYSALLLYYAYEREETPRWAKRTVLGVLGYLLMPFDAVPDLTPILGYTDDVTMLAAGLTAIAVYVNKDVKERARTKLRQWLPESTDRELTEVDDRLDP